MVEMIIAPTNKPLTRGTAVGTGQVTIHTKSNCLPAIQTLSTSTTVSGAPLLNTQWCSFGNWVGGTAYLVFLCNIEVQSSTTMQGESATLQGVTHFSQVVHV